MTIKNLTDKESDWYKTFYALLSDVLEEKHKDAERLGFCVDVGPTMQAFDDLIADIKDSQHVYDGHMLISRTKPDQMEVK